MMPTWWKKLFVALRLRSVRKAFRAAAARSLRRRTSRLHFLALEERTVPAVVNYVAVSGQLTFTADPGDADAVTVTAPAPTTLRIQVGNSDAITLAGDAVGNVSFVLTTTTNPNDTLTILTATAPANLFTINLGDQNDTLSFGLAAPLNGVGRVVIDGQAGVDTVTLTDTTLGDAGLRPGTLAVTADTINVNGAVNTTAGTAGTVALTADRNIVVNATGSVTTSTGDITLLANQGTAAGTGAFAGIQILGGAVTSTGAGNITLRGRGGDDATTGSHFGVQLQTVGTAAARVVSSGTGAVTIAGQGGTGTQQNIGVSIDGSGATVSSARGAITITGVAGTGTGTGAIGVALLNGGQIASTGTGVSAASVTVTGTGAAGTGQNDGVLFALSANSRILTVDGAVTVRGTAGSASSGITLLGGSGITATGTGPVTLLADSMDLAGGTVAAGNSTVTLAPLTAGTAISLGGPDATGTLGLSAAELNVITAAQLVIGNPSAGNITTAAAVTPTGTTVLTLTTGGSIVDGTLAEAADITVGTLNLNAGVAIGAAGTGGLDVDAAILNASRGTAAGINVFVTDTANGLAVGQIDAGTGNVTLTSAGGPITGVAPNNNVAEVIGNVVTLNVTAAANGATGQIGFVSGGAQFFEVQANTLNATTNNSRLWIAVLGGAAVGTVNAGTETAFLRLNGGTLISAAVDGTADVIAGTVNLSTTGAGGTFGTSAASPLEINATNLTANVTGTGALNVRDTAGGLTVTSAQTANGPINVEATGANANLTVATINAPGNAVTLAAPNGAIFDDNDNSTRISANTLAMTARDAIGQPGATAGMDTAVTTLTASTTGTGAVGVTPGIWVADADDLTLTSVTTADGFVVIDAGANLTATSVTANGTGRNVRLQALNGNLALGSVSATGNIVLLNAPAGAITDANGPAVNVTAASLLAIAANGIGSGNALETAVTTLAALDTAAGNIEVANTGALTVGVVTAFGTTATGAQRVGGAGGNILLSAASPLTVNAPVIDAVGGDIVLTAANDGGNDDHLTINAEVRASGGNGSIALNAGTDLIVNDGGVANDVSVAGTGAINANVTRTTFINANASIVSAGGAITFTTDDIVIDTATGTINATANGRVTVQPTTAGRTINLGTDVAGALALTDGELKRVTAAVLTVGRNDASAAGAVTVSAAVAPTNVPTLSIRTGSTVTETAGPITVTELAVRANGAVNLGGVANAVSRLAISTGTGAVSYRSAGGFEIGTVDGLTGMTTPGNVTLRADAGTVTQTQSVSAAGLELLGGAGSYQLDSLANAVTTIAATGSGFVAFRNGGALAVGTVNATIGITTANNRVTLCSDSGPLTLAASISAGNETVRLVSGNGVNQTAGTITAAALGARTTAGDISLAAGPNRVPVLAIASAGGFVYNSAIPFTFGSVGTADCFTQPVNGLTIGPNGDLTLCQATGDLNIATPISTTGTVRLTATAGNVTQTAAGTITAGNLGAVAGGSVILDTAVNQVAATGSFAAQAGADVRYRDADGFMVGAVGSGPCFPGATGASAANTVLLQNNTGGTVSQTQKIVAAGLGLSGAGPFVLDSLTGAQANTVATLAVNVGTGSVRYADADGLTLGTVATTAGPAVSIIGVTTNNADATICADVNPGTAAGGLTLAANVAIGTGTLRMQSVARILQTGGSINAGALGARTTAGEIDLSVGTNNIGILDVASAGDFSYSYGIDYVVGTVTALGCFTADVSGISVGPPVPTPPGSGIPGGPPVIGSGNLTFCRATGDLVYKTSTPTTGTVRLLAVNGNVTQTVPIVAGNLGAVAGGTGHSVVLDTFDNNVTGTFAARANANVNFRDLNGFTVGTVTPFKCFTTTATGVQSTGTGDINLTDKPLLGLGADTGITVALPVIATEGNVTITADLQEIQNTVRASTATANGCVTLQQFTDRQNVNVGGTGATSAELALSNAELNFVTARILRVGRNDLGFAATLTVTAPIALNTAATPGAPPFEQTPPNTLVLRSAGPMTEATGGTLTVRNLAVQTAGPVALNGDNVVTTLAAQVANANALFSFTEAPNTLLTIGSVDVCGATAAGITTNNGDVTITADRLDVTQPINTRVGTPVPAGGCVILQQRSNIGVDVGGATDPVGGPLTLSNAELNRVTARAVRVGRNDAGFTGALTVTAPITLAAVTGPPAAGTDTLTLAAGGDITEQPGGTLSVRNLGVVAGGAVRLGNVNSFQTVFVNAGANQDVTVRNRPGAKLTIGPVEVCGAVVTPGVCNGNVTYTADDIDIITGVCGVCVTFQPETAGQAVTLGSEPAGTLGLTNAELQFVTATQALVIGRANAGPIQVTAPIDLTAVTTSLALISNGAITEATGAVPGTLTVRDLAVQAGGAVLLDPASAANPTAANRVSNLAGTSNGAFTFRDAANVALTLDRLIVCGVPYPTSADCAIVSNNGDITITADNLSVLKRVQAGTGCVTLQQQSTAQIVNVGGADAAGTLGLTDAELDLVTSRVLRVGRNDTTPAGAPYTGALTVSAPITLSIATAAPATGTNTLVLRSGGAVTEATGGTLSVRNLAVLAAGPVTLDGDNNVFTLAGQVAGTGAAFRFTEAPNGPTGDPANPSLTIGSVDVCGATAAGILTNNGDITLTTDTLEIITPVNAGTGCATLQQRSLPRPINLGTEATGALSLKDAELDFVTAGSGTASVNGLRIGRTDATGAITIDAALTQAGSGYTRLALRSGGTIAEPPVGALPGTPVSTIQVDNLLVLAGGNVSLDGDNRVGNLAGNVTGAGAFFRFTEAPNTLLTIAAVTVCTDSFNGIMTNNGDITITADQLAVTAPVNAGSGCVTLQQRTPSVAVDLGGADAAGTLGLTDAELDFVTAGSGLTIGRNDSGYNGDIVVSGAITQAGGGYTALELRTLGNVRETTGSLAVSPLAVRSGAAVTLTSENNVVARLAGVSVGPFRFVDNVPTLTVDSVTVCADTVNGITTTNADVLVVNRGNAISLAQPISTSGTTATVRLQTARRLSQQPAGVITAGAVGARLSSTAASAAGDAAFIQLDQANTVPVFAAQSSAANASISFATQRGLTVGSVAADVAPFNTLFAPVDGVSIAGANATGATDVVLLQTQNLNGQAAAIGQSAAGAIQATLLGVRNTGTAGNIILNQTDFVVGGADNVIGRFTALNTALGGQVNLFTRDALSIGTAAGGTFPLTRGITTINGDSNIRTGTDFTAEDPAIVANPAIANAVPLIELGTAGTFSLNPGQTPVPPGQENGAVVRTVRFNAEIHAFRAFLGFPAPGDVPPEQLPPQRTPGNAAPTLPPNPFRETFFVRPSSLIGDAIYVNGNAPTVLPGDSLGVFLDPTITDISVARSPTATGAGSFTSSTRKPLFFTGIEQLTQVNGGGALVSFTAFVEQTGPRPNDFRLLVRQFVGSTGNSTNSQPIPFNPPASNPFIVVPAQVNPLAPVSAPELAVADVNGDGQADLIFAAGSGSSPLVTIVDGNFLLRANANNATINLPPQAIIAQFFAYDPNFLGGVFVAAADLDGNGRAEVVTGAGAGGGPHVKVFKVVDDPSRPSGLRADLYALSAYGSGGFFAYDPRFAGGVRVAAATGAGRSVIVTGAGPGGGPHVRTFDGKTGVPLAGAIGGFFAYDPTFTGGVYVATRIEGVTPATSVINILTGAGAGGGPHVKIFKGSDITQSFTLAASFIAFDVPRINGQPVLGDFSFFTGVGGVSFIAADDPIPDDVVVTTGRGRSALARVFHSPTYTPAETPVDDPQFFDGLIPGIIAS